MDKESYINRIYELMRDHQDWRNSPDEDIVKTLVWDVEGKSGGEGEWDNDIAAQQLKEFEWLLNQP